MWDFTDIALFSRPRRQHRWVSASVPLLLSISSGGMFKPCLGADEARSVHRPQLYTEVEYYLKLCSWISPDPSHLGCCRDEVFLLEGKESLSSQAPCSFRMSSAPRFQQWAASTSHSRPSSFLQWVYRRKVIGHWYLGFVVEVRLPSRGLRFEVWLDLNPVGKKVRGFEDCQLQTERQGSGGDRCTFMPAVSFLPTGFSFAARVRQRHMVW